MADVIDKVGEGIEQAFLMAGPTRPAG